MINLTKEEKEIFENQEYMTCKNVGLGHISGGFVTIEALDELDAELECSVECGVEGESSEYLDDIYYDRRTKKFSKEPVREEW